MLSLIYIASNGRSGSTLLDMILGAHEACWTTGELQVLAHEVQLPTKPCGCGKMVDECGFWKPIMEGCRDLLQDESFNLFRERMGAGRVLRWSQLWRIMFSMKGEAVRRYAEVNMRLMEKILTAVRKEKGPQVDHLVDASKDPYRLSALMSSPDINVKAIHLVKDPRAFVYSMTKNISGRRLLYRSVRMSLRYLVENTIIDIACRALPANRRYLLCYEDLASNPEVSLDRLCDHLGFKRDAEAVGRFREVQHGVSGNLARHEDRPISLDRRWRRDMPRALQVLVYGLAWPQAVRYGYRWSDNRD